MTPISQKHFSSWTRRELLKRSSVAAVLTAVPLRFAAAEASGRIAAVTAGDLEESAQRLDPDLVRTLALRAIDAAKAAGATYAEARITRTVSQSFVGAGLLLDKEQYGLGVRALVNGAWGFTASPYLNLDEAGQLAKDAVEQAKINARVFPREVDLGTYPVATGSWSTPIRIDPFTIPMEEKIDFVRSFGGILPRHVKGRVYNAGLVEMMFQRQERAVATTDNAFFTQTLYQAMGDFRVTVVVEEAQYVQTQRQSVAGRGTNFAGGGWERILDADLRGQIPGLIDEAESLLFVPVKPVEIGRYDVVCDAGTVADLISGTLGQATELDRALGYEANAGGTSYLGPDPFTYLGTAIGAPQLTVTADRSMAKGLATVKWDDEGVEPETFPLIQDGVLVDYQTTREQPAWLASWYQQHNRPLRSHGCSTASSALDMPLQRTPNLTLRPGGESVGLDDLIANTKRGLVITGGQTRMDFQSRSGAGAGAVREVTNGKLGAIIDGAGYLFDSAQLWKTLQVLGGAASAESSPAGGVKGQPAQASSYTVSAVPSVFKDMAIIDVRRKA